MLPIMLYWYSDGLYVLATTKEYSEILGHRILSFNQIPAKTIVDSLSTLFTVDNYANIKQGIPQYIPSIQILRYLKLTESEKIELKYNSSDGEEKTIIMKPSIINKNNVVKIKPIYNPDSLAFCYKNQKLLFAENYIAENKIYYLQYNRCWSKELEIEFGRKDNAERLPSFNEFEHSVFEVLKTKPVEKLIFDLRFNGGGNSIQGTNETKKLACDYTHKLISC